MRDLRTAPEVRGPPRACHRHPAAWTRTWVLDVLPGRSGLPARRPQPFSALHVPWGHLPPLKALALALGRLSTQPKSSPAVGSLVWLASAAGASAPRPCRLAAGPWRPGGGRRGSGSPGSHPCTKAGGGGGQTPSALGRSGIRQKPAPARPRWASRVLGAGGGGPCMISETPGTPLSALLPGLWLENWNLQYLSRF